jgi:hypothetical protein
MLRRQPLPQGRCRPAAAPVRGHASLVMPRFHSKGVHPRTPACRLVCTASLGVTKMPCWSSNHVAMPAGSGTLNLYEPRCAHASMQADRHALARGACTSTRTHHTHAHAHHTRTRIPHTHKHACTHTRTQIPRDVWRPAGAALAQHLRAADTRIHPSIHHPSQRYMSVSACTGTACTTT